MLAGCRLNEIQRLRWENVDLQTAALCLRDAKTGVPLELPITRQLVAILERRLAEADDYQPGVCQRRSKTRPCGGAKVGHFGSVRSLSP